MTACTSVVLGLNVKTLGSNPDCGVKAPSFDFAHSPEEEVACTSILHAFVEVHVTQSIMLVGEHMFPASRVADVMAVAALGDLVALHHTGNLGKQCRPSESRTSASVERGFHQIVDNCPITEGVLAELHEVVLGTQTI